MTRLTSVQVGRGLLLTTMESATDVGPSMPTDEQCDYYIDFTNETSLVVQGMLYTPVTTGLVTVILPLILIIGVVSNGAFLIVLFRVRWMRTITNFYLANLSVADMMFVMVTGAEHIWGYASSPIPGDDMHLGKAGCILATFIIYACYFGSVLLVTLVSLHRFFAICIPTRQDLIGSRQRTIKLVTGTWAISFSIAIMLIPSVSRYMTHCLIWPEGEEYQSLPTVMAACQPVAPWVADVATLAQTVPFFFAVIGNSFMYGRIIKSLTTRVEKRKEQTKSKNAAPTTVERARDKVARMLIANGVIFFVCLGPFQAMGFADVITRKFNTHRILTESQYHAFLWVSKILGYSNSAMNPIIYNATNPRYRQAFCEAFPCLPNKKDRDSPPQSQMTRQYRSETQQYTTCVSKL